jgi:hypothetical protein
MSGDFLEIMRLNSILTLNQKEETVVSLTVSVDSIVSQRRDFDSGVMMRVSLLSPTNLQEISYEV